MFDAKRHYLASVSIAGALQAPRIKSGASMRHSLQRHGSTWSLADVASWRDHPIRVVVG